MKRKIRLISFLAAAGLSVLVCWPGSGLKADDRAIFSASVKPYIMFMFDNSGSMTTRDYYISSADYASFITYTLQGVTPATTYSFSYPAVPYNDRVVWSSTYNAYVTSRINALKRVAIELLDVFRNDVKMGFGHFLYPPDVPYKERYWDGTKYILRDRVVDNTSNPDGAVVRNGITDLSGSTRDADLISICNTVYGFTGDGNTPLAESLDTIYGYFKGTISSSDGNSWTDYNGFTRIPAGATPPSQYTCQNTYIVLVSDGEPTDDRFDYETVRNYWGTGSTQYTTLKTHDYSHPYTSTVLQKDNGMNDLPNVAKWIYEHPIPDATTGLIPAQGISTWCVGMRLSGDGRTRLVVASDNAHGRGKYYDGDDYATLRDQLISAIGQIVEQSYAFTSYTSPKKITGSGDDIYLSYQGYFFNKPSAVPIWEGHLKCLKIEPQGTSYQFVEQWDAAAKLATQGEAARSLWTQVPSHFDSGTNKFAYTTYEFKSTNQAALQKSLNVSTSTIAGTVINYIRGNMTTRGISDPAEQFYLADIFHSDIIYVGMPLAWKSLYDTSACDVNNAASDTDCYKNFYLTHASRQKAVYMGTNDGVIHQVNADQTGATAGYELSGFIPDEVLPRLKNIAINSDFTYTTDGRMTAADIYSPTNKWQTVLVFGLREGGKAYYCRNISNPASTSFKWKFPEYVAAATIASKSGTTTITLTTGSATGTFAVGQYLVNEAKSARTLITAVAGNVLTVSNNTLFAVADKVLALPAYAKYIGQTWCKPVIGRLKYKKGAAGTETAVWAVMFTAGLGDGTNEEGKGLFIVNADTGAPIYYLGYAAASSAGNDFYLSNAATLDHPIPQSLTAVDLDNDTYIDTVYFGNTGGHMFKLNVANPLTTTWVPQLLFQGDSTKPIYLSPSVSYDQCYKLWLHFGSGNRNAPQSGVEGQFVAMRDQSTITYPLTTANLQELSWSSDATNATSDTSKSGWYFDLLDPGEILFDPDPVIVPDNSVPYLYFNTYQPSTVVVGGDPCGTGGNMHIYSIRLPYCASNGAYTFSGIREAGRISGGGLYGSDSYLMYVGTSQTGSITIKEFKESTMQYPGGVFYFKEVIR